MNRIEPIKEELEQTVDQEDLMLIIMDALNDTVEPIPEVGKFYTFLYSAKTPKIVYDQHPLVACMEIYEWGFRGLNFHWQHYKNYTWNEIVGQLYVVEFEELDDLLAVPYAKYVTK